MDTQLSVHRYSPLGEPDSIRILVLEPALDSAAELRGHFVYTTLSHCANDLFDGYIALSYVWGDPTMNCSIIIQNEEIIYITTSLHVALRDIRDTSRRLRVWADAICINQSDIPERNTQVGFMGNIYKNATITVIYIDPAPDAKTKRMLKLVMSSRWEQISADEQQDVTDWCESYLVTRPWFTRVWVFQEFVLSRDPRIQCGRLRVHWSDLHNLVRQATGRRFPDLKDLNSSSLGILKSMNHYRSEHSTIKLIDIMEDRRAYRATDPRDMVFAHLGLVSDRTYIPKYLQVDYSLPLCKVYGTLGRYYMHARGFEALIASVECLEPLDARGDIPSWAPDWRYPRAVSHPLAEIVQYPSLQFYEDMSEVSKLRRKTQGLVDSDNHFVLSTVGYTEDTIKFLSAPIPAQKHKTKEELRQIEIELRPFRESYHKSDCTADDYQRYRDAVKPLGDKIIELLRESTQGASMETDSHEDFFDVFQDWLYYEIAIEYSWTSVSTSVVFNIMRRYFGLDPRRKETWQGDLGTLPLPDRRRLMYTHGGQFGIAPLHARPGDFVIVIPASRTPIVVRPLKDEGQEDMDEYISKQVRENIGHVYLSQREGALHHGYDFNVRDVDILRVRHCVLLGEGLIDGHFEDGLFRSTNPVPDSLRQVEVYAIH